MRESKYRWRYIYLLQYANGCRNIPYKLAEKIAKSNHKKMQKEGNLMIELETYDGGRQVVHPDIVKWNNELWMVCTPYPYSIETYENPCIYHGNTVFDMTPVLDKPLAYPEYRKKGNHISDPCIFVNQSKLSVLFRDTVKIDGIITQKLYICESEDGYKWSKKKLVLQSKEKSYISPAVFAVDNHFVMYYVQLTTTTGGYLKKVTFNANFHQVQEEKTTCHNIPDGMTIWHIGIINEKGDGKALSPTDTKLHGIFTLRSIENLYQYELYWAHLNIQNKEWYIDEKVEIPTYLQKHISNVYKCAIIPSTNDVVLSFYDYELQWNLCLIPGLRDRKEVICEKNLLDSYRVFSRVFQNTMPYERFLYKHIENPNRLNLYYIHMSESNKTIGTNCFNGAKAVSTVNQFMIAQSCDTAVVPEARGKGVFVNMIDKAVEILKDQKVDLMVGFPNNNSYHGFMKLGWKHIGNYKTLIFLSHPIDIIASKIGHHNKKAGSVKISVSPMIARLGIMEKDIYSQCPFNEEDLMLINNDGQIKIARTYEYFLWKIDGNNPDFKYLTLRKNGILKAYIVFRVNDKGRVFITDWYVDRENPEIFKGCLFELFSSVKNIGNTIVIPMISQGSEEFKLLKEFGFVDGNKKLYGYPLTKMITYPLTEIGEIYSGQFDRWFISAIDVDIVIS